MDNKPAFQTIQILKQLGNGTPFKTVAAVRRIHKKIGKTGNPFLQIEVGDAVDTLTFNCFDGTAPFLFFQKSASKCPQIIFIEGFIEFYAEKLSPRIKSIQDVPEEQYETYLPDVIETPAEPLEELQASLTELVESIQYPALRATVRQVFDDLGEQFTNSVAAVSMHHAYIHGLLEHTVHVTRVVQALLPLYAEVDADLAIAGALLHDVGKVLEYQYTATEGIDRTDIGRLQGHVVLGYRLTRSAALRNHLHPTWLEQLEHIVLSHQGEPEWGAAVYPATAEAVLVSLADNADARMGMVHQQLKKAVPTQTFSDFVPGLETRLYTKALVKTEATEGI